MKANQTLLCDFYELTMANGYFELGKGVEIAPSRTAAASPLPRGWIR